MLNETSSILPSRSNTDELRSRRYAVIGAGAGGLCAAKYLLENGFNVTVYEIGTEIGGLWCYENDNGLSSAYKTLHINTAKDLTAFSDFGFPDNVQMFPDHWDMHRYLVAYAEHFDLIRHIQFKSRVIDVRPARSVDGKRWEVDVEGGQTEVFDGVIVASGHLSKPIHVPLFKENFKGEYIHSHDYREPEPYVGKRICIVGVGNSAVDIASDVCATSPRTVLVARSGVVIAPKVIFGIPTTEFTLKLYKWWVPDWLRRRAMSWLTYLMHGDMTKMGFKRLTGRAHPTTSATVVADILYNRVVVKQGIERIDGRQIYFVDGTNEEFDVLVAATGYLIDLPFISTDIVSVKDNAVDLYKRISPPGRDGLYFVGMLNATLPASLNMLFELQSKWICSIERGEAELPSSDQMRADIEAKKRWIAKYYHQSPRHTIEEESLFYIKELEEALKQSKKRVLSGGKVRSGGLSTSPSNQRVRNA